jgi:hypothetical protein
LLWGIVQLAQKDQPERQEEEVMPKLKRATLGFVTLFAMPTGVIAQSAPPAPPELKCPVNGYSKPAYGGFGDNDGLVRAYEIAGPCVLKEAIAAAEALGMARYKPVGVKNISTVRFGATGVLADDSARLAKHTDIDFAISYMEPAIRITTSSKGFESPEAGRVFADGKAWNEGAPGMNTRKAPGSAAAARAPLLLLTPFGALLAIIEAEGHATVSREGGRTVLSGTSPYNKLPVKLVLDEKMLPISVEVRAGKDVYAATFADYKSDWEPPYLFTFPAKINWSLNGKPYANLDVTRFKSNPYVIFPVPANLANAK